MAVAVPYHFTTAASNNLQPVKAGQSGKLKGFAIANASGVNCIKLYWFTPTASNTGPTVGTTVPNLTLAFASGVNDHEGWPDGITGNGQLWVAVTGAAADNDNTNATAGAVITLFVE